MTTEATTTAAAIFEFPSTMRVHHATRKAAETLAAMFAAEYPALVLSYTPTDMEWTAIATWNVAHVDPDADEGDKPNVIWQGPKVPQLADILDICEEEGLDPEAVGEDDEDDEPKASGSVVPETYRQQYRESSSNGQTCGDWLAEWLVTQTHGGKGFVVEDFTAILDQNAVDRNTKWGRLPESGQPGWVGRYRMNGRQALEKVIAKRGFAFDHNSQTHDVPAEALEVLRAKHAKWLAKEAKLEAAAAAAVKEAVEGAAPETTEA